MNGSDTNEKTFAFLIHPRHYSDVMRAYPLARLLPRFLVDWYTKHARPIIFGKVYDQRGDGEKVIGYLIGLPMNAHQMLRDREVAKRRVDQALTLAKKHGAGIVGLGAMTSVVTSGGLDLVGNKQGIAVTNGNALTVAMAWNGILESAEKKGINLSESVVAIVGATGSIGKALSRLIAQQHSYKELILVGKTKENVDQLERELGIARETASIRSTVDLQDAKQADVIIIATSASGVLIDTDFPKEGALIFDITQPRNTSADMETVRPDVSLFDGGIVRLPHNIRYSGDIGLAKRDAFACLSETIILALDGHEQDFSVGVVTLENVMYIRERAQVRDFCVAT